MDWRLNRLNGYLRFHHLMLETGDCDPQYPAMRYIADRFELNREQRYWLAYLFSCSYCAPTAYYMLNEFPDYENVDLNRLERWWLKNKHLCYFQSDRAKVKNFNQIVRMVASYQELMAGNQESAYREYLRESPSETYDEVYSWLSGLHYFGRFSLFLLMESVHELTGYPMMPTDLWLPEAETCREGLCLATTRSSWVGRLLTKEEHRFLQKDLALALATAKEQYPGQNHTYWNIETSLCAYRKLWKQSRYLGYYIDRQQEEIRTMERNVPEGVNWQPLWDFRREYFHSSLLGEWNGWNGIRKNRTSIFLRTGHFIELEMPRPTKRIDYFESGSAYAQT